MEAPLNIDTEIVLWLNQWVGRFAPLDEAGKLLVSDYFLPACIALCILALWFVGADSQARDSRQKAVLTAIISMGFASWVVFIINDHYFRPRPFVDHEITLLFYQPTDPSFPAHPAAASFGMASGVWQGSRKMGVFVYGLAALWGLSRIFAGVFYPSDVVVGALIGVVMGYLVAGGLRLIEPVPTLVLRGARMLHLA